jgi:tripartite-type tricarboxylate transporter receptor subunit TctC
MGESMWRAAVMAAAAMFACGGADAADGFYKGKAVSVYVGASPGGTNDLATRLIVKHLPKHVDGRPTMVVKNMPGAGSRKLAAYLYSHAPKDGTEFGTVDRNVFTDWLLQTDKTNLVDPRELTWLGSPVQETLTCVSWKTSPVQSLDDLKSKPFVIGSTGAASGETLHANILNTYLGAKVKTISGYPGGSEMNLAMQRGETDGRCGLGWGAIKAGYFGWVEAKDMKVLIQNALESHPELEGVPVLADLVSDGPDKQALTLLLADQKVGRPMIGPAGLPTARRDELRKALDDTFKDPEFLSEAAASKYEIRPIGGEAITKLLDSLFAIPQPVVERAQKIANY